MLQLMNLKQNTQFKAYSPNMLLNVRPYSVLGTSSLGCIFAWTNTARNRRSLCIDIT